MKNIFFALSVLLFTSCFDIISTFTLNNNVVSSSEFVIASSFGGLGGGDAMENFTKQFDYGFVEIGASDTRMEMYFEFDRKLVFNEQSYQHALHRLVDIDSGIENSSEITSDLSMFLPAINNNILSINLRPFTSAMQEEMDNDPASIAMTRALLSSVTWDFTFISEDDTEIDRVYYVDRRGRQIPIGFEQNRRNFKTFSIPFFELVAGNVTELRLILR